MTIQSEDAENVFKAPGYSPYAGRNFPTRVYWGDTHVHTNLSLEPTQLVCACPTRAALTGSFLRRHQDHPQH